MAGRLPNIPDFLIKPFADKGNKLSIPEEQASPGRASLDLGFPPETQLPLSEGGVAPNRLDFQGILNQLAQFAFYYQSGGIMPYAQNVNYVRPALVYHDGEYWFCEQANGPDAPAGLVTPGANDSIWTQFNPKKKSGGTPVGAIITYWGAVSPEGYLACNGGAFSATQYPELYRVLGRALTPDLRGYFVRGYDTRNTIDPNGAMRSVGSIQNDSMQQMTGFFSVDWYGKSTNGVFYDSGLTAGGESGSGHGNGRFIYFDNSRQVRVSSENRPKNICLLYCIKHD